MSCQEENRMFRTTGRMKRLGAKSPERSSRRPKETSDAGHLFFVQGVEKTMRLWYNKIEWGSILCD